jgi:hypothetical protein
MRSTRASWVMAAASSCALLAGCSLLTTWDGLTSDSGGAPDAGADAPEDGPHDAGAEAGVCDPMGHYCGGDVVSGDPSTLYRCNGSSPPTVIAHCVVGCEMHAGGVDVCKGSGSCFDGGHYCGGDKVTGDPTALYKCTSGSTGTLIAQCATTCVWNNGIDDACQ